MFSAYRIARVFNLIRVLAQLKSDLLDLQNFLWRFKMSSDKVTYSCATCSNAIRGREHFAICVLCPRRVHRKCYGGCLSNDIWAVLYVKWYRKESCLIPLFSPPTAVKVTWNQIDYWKAINTSIDIQSTTIFCDSFYYSKLFYEWYQSNRLMVITFSFT